MTTSLLVLVALFAQNPLTTVPRVDLSRYAGEWFEIARTPNKYESDCVSDVRLFYALRPDGRLSVRNECATRSGKPDIAKGSAKSADPTNARLRVSFFWPFSYDYWIIDLDESYRYAVVGEPSRKDLWILSRTPSLPPATYGQILRRAATQGYDTSRVVMTPQKER
jgi:apolipoprotein D and lipocalin family protein